MAWRYTCAVHPSDVGRIPANHLGQGGGIEGLGQGRR